MCLAIVEPAAVFLTSFSEAFGGAAGLTEEQLGRIAAVVFGGFVVGIAVANPLADDWGASVRGFRIGVVIGGLGLLGMANSYATLLMSVFLGLGAGMLKS